MATSSVQEKFLSMQREIDGLDRLCCARMKRTVKVESELRAVAAAAAPEVKITLTRQQLMDWAIMLGVPEEMQLKGITT